MILTAVAFASGGIVPGPAPARESELSWTIFITPEGFVGNARKIQTRAIESWLLLKPKPSVVLAGVGVGYEEVARKYNLQVVPGLDLNFVQMPLAGSLVDLAMHTPGADVSVIVNSDILLTQSFVAALLAADAEFDAWFLTGARIDLHGLPAEFKPTHASFSDEAFTRYASNSGVLHTAGGTDYFAWNNKRTASGVIPLTATHMPPFIRGKSKFDNWFVHEVIEGGHREVIDGTAAVVVVHINHAYKSAAPSGATVNANEVKKGSTFWQSGKLGNWQIFHNIHLAIAEGTYQNQDGTTLHAPWKLASCTGGGQVYPCLQKRLRPGACPCEYSPFAMETQTDPTVIYAMTAEGHKKGLLKCGALSRDDSTAYDIVSSPSKGQAPVFGLPFTLEMLLPMVARNNHVVLTGVSYNYRFMLMNFVCNLRRLGVYDTLIVAAWDEEMYQFCFKMGLPVFLYETDVFGKINMKVDMAYGSQAFRKVTKLKSQVVLAILKKGYDVTWTDTDIAWLQNPIPLMANMESDFVVQSNAPSKEAVANGPLRINSGFYRVRSTPKTIVAMEQIVLHAAASPLTEQPSFYMVLCGGKEGNFKRGDSECLYPGPGGVLLQDVAAPTEGCVAQVNNCHNCSSDGSTCTLCKNGAFLHQGNCIAACPAGATPTGKGNFDRRCVVEPPLLVEYLSRDLYPAGAYNALWEDANVRNSATLVILHNNWIKGMQNKIQRLMDKRLWYYDREKRICSYAPEPTFVLDWTIEAD